MTTPTALRFAFGLAALAVIPPAGAQPVLSPGTRVRVTTSVTWRADGSRVVTTAPEQLVGTLGRVNPDTLVVTLEAGEALVPTREAYVEVSRGQRSQALPGAFLGLIAGGFAGGLLGSASYTEPPPCEEGQWFCGSFDFGRGGAAAGGAVLGGLTGLVVGAIAGAGTRTERWEQAASPVTVSVGAVRAPGARVTPSVAVRVALR